jgi:hypothetical protein
MIGIDLFPFPGFIAWVFDKPIIAFIQWPTFNQKKNPTRLHNQR